MEGRGSALRGSCNIYGTLQRLFAPAGRWRVLVVGRGGSARLPWTAGFEKQPGLSLSQDAHGNTPLHLAVCQAAVPWEVVLDLVERGARIAQPNKEGVTPADLAPAGLLARLQDQMLAECWLGFHSHHHQGGHPGGQAAQASSTPQPLQPQAIGADPPSTGASSVCRGDGRSDRE